MLEQARQQLAQAIGTAMKRTLVTNDMHGNAAVREAVLANMNDLNRFSERLFTGLLLKCQDTMPSVPISSASA